MHSLTCQEVILDHLADCLDASLNDEALADFERHLESCAACRAYLQTYRKTGEVDRRTTGVQMPQEMKAHLRHFLLTHLTNGQH